MHRIKFKINTVATAIAAAIIIMLLTSGVCALSAPDASGQINSASGAYLRKSSSTDSARLALLGDDTLLTIHKEIFSKKSDTSAKYRWYYVTANGKKGYVRADLVDHIEYDSVSGKTVSAVNYRKGAGTKMKKAGSFAGGKSVVVCLAAVPVSSSKGSSSTWYKIRVGSGYYYICSSKIRLLKPIIKTAAGSSAGSTSDAGLSKLTDKQFEEYLTEQGFPETYKIKLRKLHEVHPAWVFKGYKTGIKWSDALAKQTKGGVSLISASRPKSYRDGSRQYEKGWYKANKKVVAYYMDPRNFLNEDRIYMFEDLLYDQAYQTKTVVSAILAATKLPEYGFSAKLFVKAGAKHNISPVFLASRARQETGSGSDAVKGTKILGKKVYNPFNIGAFGGSNPLKKGLLYAYSKGWTTQYKAVEGGAEELSKNYISKGQSTVYYQRFNVRNGKRKAGTHQYMTNIMAPYSESLSTKKSYASYGVTDQALVFEIPIYTSMPKATKLP